MKKGKLEMDLRIYMLQNGNITNILRPSSPSTSATHFHQRQSYDDTTSTYFRKVSFY